MAFVLSRDIQQTRTYYFQNFQRLGSIWQTTGDIMLITIPMMAGNCVRIIVLCCTLSISAIDFQLCVKFLDFLPQLKRRCSYYIKKFLHPSSISWAVTILFSVSDIHYVRVHVLCCSLSDSLLGAYSPIISPVG